MLYPFPIIAQEKCPIKCPITLDPLLFLPPMSGPDPLGWAADAFLRLPTPGYPFVSGLDSWFLTALLLHWQYSSFLSQSLESLTPLRGSHSPLVSQMEEKAGGLEAERSNAGHSSQVWFGFQALGTSTMHPSPSSCLTWLRPCQPSPRQPLLTPQSHLPEPPGPLHASVRALAHHVGNQRSSMSAWWR